jgi:hypothetical protein
MGQLRASDHAVAAVCALALWLLVRTALRVEAAPSALLVSAGYGAALVLRRRAGAARPDPRVALYGYLLALVATRVVERCWELPRREALTVMACCSIVLVGGALWPTRAEVAWAFFAFASVLGVAFSSGAWVASALCLRALARVSAAVFESSEPAAWLRIARWIVAVGAAAWAVRGATVGPFALMVGAGGAAAYVRADGRASSARQRGGDWATLGLAAGWIVLARAWEQSALLFL